MRKFCVYHPRKCVALSVVYITYISSIIFFIIKTIANPPPKGIVGGLVLIFLGSSFAMIFVWWIRKIIIGKYIRCESCFWLCGFSDLQYNNGVCPLCDWDRFSYPEVQHYSEDDIGGKLYIYTLNQRQTFTQIKLANKEKRIWKDFRTNLLTFEWWKRKKS